MSDVNLKKVDIGKTLFVSPYKAAQMATAWLERTELSGKIAPQMMYAYANEGRIPASKNEQDKWQIWVPDLEEWFEGYLDRRRETEERLRKQEENRRRLAG